MKILIKSAIYFTAFLGLMYPILIGPKPGMFADQASFFCMIFVPIPIMFFIQGKRAFLLMQEKGKIRNAIIDQWNRIIFSWAGATVLIGSVQILSNLNDPRLIGPSAAVAILTLLYALVAKVFIFEPLRDIES